jgi:hypothetical protein
MHAKESTAGGIIMGTKRMGIGAVCVILLLVMAPAASAIDQKMFATPTEAVRALVKAVEDGDQDEMLAVFGDDGKELVFSGDPVQDKASREAFLRAYEKKHVIVAQNETTRVLQVGANNWEMPIPIVKSDGKWRFDTAAGKQELLYRRIGANELGAISVCLGFISAQQDYAATGHDGLPAEIYAQRLNSEPGKQNGLYWEVKEGEEMSPGGPLLAQASDEGYEKISAGRSQQPYHGYYFRILKAQGAAAKGGAKSYLADGKLTGGVALLAFPAQYKVSGVMSFIVNQDGVVYQEDLGEKTDEVARAITEYNPDSTWKRVQEVEK